MTMITSINEILSKLRKIRVYVAGDLILDKYVWGTVSRISPEAPIQILNVTKEEYRPGGAANVARNVSSLGAQVLVSGLVGNDDAASTLIRLLKSEGIKTGDMVSDPQKPTSMKTRMIAHNQQILRVDKENSLKISSAVERRLLKPVERQSRRNDLAIIADYQKGTVTPKLAREIINYFRGRNKPVFVGLKSKDYQKYKYATGASLNRQELFDLARMNTLDEAAQFILKDLKLKVLLVTLGDQGMKIYQDDGISFQLPTVAREVYDVTGAGDTVVACFSTCYAAGLILESCAAIANVAAGIVVAKVGTEVATQQELIDALIVKSHLSTSKILDERNLLLYLKRERKKGKKIVFTNGCFDLLHAGHVQLLEFAKSKGDILIVGMNSDKSIRMIKGDTRPLNPQDQRARVVASLECCDYVTLFDEQSPYKLIKRIRPDILVKGADYKLQRIVGSDVVSKYGGKILLAPYLEGASTSNLISRIVMR